MTPRFKVWPSTNGKVDLFGIILRTGTTDEGPIDVIYAGITPAEVAAFACARKSYVGDVFVKNFDTGEWFKVTIGQVTVEPISQPEEIP